MKKNFVKIMIFVLILSLSLVCFVACNKDPNENQTPTGETYTVDFDLNYNNPVGTIDAQTVESGAKATLPTAPARENFAVRGWYKEATLATLFDFTTETITQDTTLYAGWSSTLYYVAGNFTGYEAAMEGFNLDEVAGQEGWFSKTVELTSENRDQTYDGHYYKITNGTWTTEGTWGVDNYALDPAPASPTGGGLGSIYIYDNCTLTIYFDSVNKVIYDNSMVRDLESPRIYGDFNVAMDRGSDWSLLNAEALTLSDPDGDGIYTGLYKIPAYTGTNEDGYSMAVAVGEKYFIDQWGNRWGIDEQYKFDGTAAGMAGTSNLKPTEETIYEFKYNSTTNVTTVTEVVKDEIQALANPTIYGDFSSWMYEGSSPITLTDTDDDGLYVGFKKLAAYEGTGDGYMMAVGIDKILYDDEWGIRWGINEQYKFDGTAAGMAGTSYLKPTEETIYEFIYDSVSHITTVTAVEKDEVQALSNPTVYGDFTNWVYDGQNAITLTDSNNDGIFEGSVFLDAYEGTGDGYMIAVAISKILYDDTWGIRWGINEQYKLDGTAAGMAGTSYLKPTEDTTYNLSYDSATHITTVTIG